MPLFFVLAALFSFLALQVQGAAQPPVAEVVTVGVLPDHNYSWPQIRTDTTLAFRPADSLRTAQARRFWLKLTVYNPSRYTAATRLTVLPNLATTLFYFDEDARAWQTRPLSVTLVNWQPLRLPGRVTTTCYVRLDLPTEAVLPQAIGLRVLLEPAGAVQAADRFYGAVWAASLAVLLLLGLASVHAYGRWRDRATWYYLWAQVGAVLYVTALQGWFREVFPAPVFSMLARPNGFSYAYTLNNVAMHLSVVVLLLSIGQMTRAYFLTSRRLPRLDAALRYALGAYCAFTLVTLLVNGGGFYLDYYTLPFHNLLALVVVGLLLAITLVAYRRRLPSAWIYLLANLLPLLGMLLVAGYNVMFGSDAVSGNLRLLPNLTVVAHALCFAAALSIRLQQLQRTLLATEREAQYLALDIQEKELRNREIVLKNSHIQAALLEMRRRQQARDEHTQQLTHDHQQQQATNQNLQEQLEANQRELASTSLYVQQKNALLAELKQQIRELNAQSPSTQSELSGIKSILQTNLYLDEDWGRFKLHFEQVHPRFFEELQARYPALTKHEQRLYCYFHIHLSTKEIAALLNIDPASVRRAKTRLYKKMAAADNGLELPATEAPQPEPTAGE
ncbi:7TM diverse intracellular signaling domain-containing protein [Hymenobacter endophyticus]|uniref:7TM diverse intracellular signaling domain-containing protein n=1 Tax=Hymenobacter endophyticus TaxID=3076335 RepID=A0ABU3TJD8_9BACT|nr:7TM diverse intracellular signaling domain-containing protein [Hymenobacter endophyticus]MDU0371489.1 7TM diverse intracellular signaling domain-containing protein [Hymenobacter endophyticus]